MRRALLSTVVFIAIGTHDTALGQSAPSIDIAPSGRLRVGMIAIQVLGGVAEPVGRFVATKLASYEPVMYPEPRGLPSKRWQGRVGYRHWTACSGWGRQSRLRRRCLG